MSTRTCIACRTRCDTDDLIPLGLGPGGSLFVGKGEGRGAWICPKATCIERTRKRPDVLARAFRAPAPNTSDLHALIQEHLHGTCVQALISCHRSGLVASGTTALMSNDLAPLFALVCAKDSSPHTVARIRAIRPQIPVYPIGLDTRSLGLVLGRGPRAVLALHPGRPTKRLCVHLRREELLG